MRWMGLALVGPHPPRQTARWRQLCPEQNKPQLCRFRKVAQHERPNPRKPAPIRPRSQARSSKRQADCQLHRGSGTQRPNAGGSNGRDLETVRAEKTDTAIVRDTVMMQQSTFTSASISKQSGVNSKKVADTLNRLLGKQMIFETGERLQTGGKVYTRTAPEGTPPPINWRPIIADLIKTHGPMSVREMRTVCDIPSHESERFAQTVKRMRERNYLKSSGHIRDRVYALPEAAA
jgi:hypothetical protein